MSPFALLGLRHTALPAIVFTPLFAAAERRPRGDGDSAVRTRFPVSMPLLHARGLWTANDSNITIVARDLSLVAQALTVVS